MKATEMTHLVSQLPWEPLWQPDSAVQVHVGWLEGGTAVFAFRGTASRQDGLQDVKILSRNVDYLQELYPGVKAHLGVCLPQSLLLMIPVVVHHMTLLLASFTLAQY